MEIITVFDDIKDIGGSYWTHPISAGHIQWKSSAGLTLKTYTAPPPFFSSGVC